MQIAIVIIVISVIIVVFVSLDMLIVTIANENYKMLSFCLTYY